MVHQPRVACGRHTCSPFSLLWLVLLFTIFYIGGCRIGRSPFLCPSPLWLRCSRSVSLDGGQLWPTVAEALAGALLGFCIPLAAAMATGGTGLGGGDIKFCGILGLIYGPSGMALVFFVAAVFAMPMVLLFRRLSRLRQPIAIPFLPFLACGCSVATLAELFL